MALSRQLRDAVRGSYLQPNDVGDDSHIYLDISIKYTEGTDIANYGRQATYQATKTQPIISNPEKYHVSVDRFQIDGKSLPIYVFNPASPPAVWLEYGGFSAKVDFIFVPQNTYVVNPSIVPFNKYYHVYDIQHFLDMMNTALATAFANLGGLVVLPVGSSSPYIVWNAPTGLASVYAQKAFYNLSLGAPIEIFFNTALHDVLLFFNTYNDAFDKWQLRMNDNYNNTQTIGVVDWLFITQQANGASGWNPVKSIIFTSSSIPVAGTYTSLNSQASNSNATNEDDTNSLAILIDFKIDPTFAMSPRTELLYVAQDNTRKLDMQGNTPLKNININIFWSDTAGNLFPLVIARNKEASIKLLFTKKTQDF